MGIPVEKMIVWNDIIPGYSYIYPEVIPVPEPVPEPTRWESFRNTLFGEPEQPKPPPPPPTFFEQVWTWFLPAKEQPKIVITPEIHARLYQRINIAASRDPYLAMGLLVAMLVAIFVTCRLVFWLSRV